MARFYLASQSKSHKYEFDNSILWSPKTNANGSVLKAYENMSQLKKGDIILNAYNACIHAISLVKDNAYNFNKPKAYGNEVWRDKGWQVDLDMHLIEIPLSPLRSWLKEHRQPKYDPFTKNGTLNMAYLSKLSDEQIAFFEQYIDDVLFKQILASSNELANRSKTASSFNATPRNNKDRLTHINNTNWEQINRIKAENGKDGEKFVLKYLETKRNKDKYIIKPISSNLAGEDGDDSVGYDILIENKENGFKEYLDVKTTESNAHIFYMSSNEKDFMENINKQSNVDYYIYRVCLKTNDRLSLNHIYDSAGLKKGDFKPINYEVNMNY